MQKEAVLCLLSPGAAVATDRYGTVRLMSAANEFPATCYQLSGLMPCRKARRWWWCAAMGCRIVCTPPLGPCRSIYQSNPRHHHTEYSIVDACLFSRPPTVADNLGKHGGVRGIALEKVYAWDGVAVRRGRSSSRQRCNLLCSRGLTGMRAWPSYTAYAVSRVRAHSCPIFQRSQP